jgi:hypothetical protein
MARLSGFADVRKKKPEAAGDAASGRIEESVKG